MRRCCGCGTHETRGTCALQSSEPRHSWTDRKAWEGEDEACLSGLEGGEATFLATDGLAPPRWLYRALAPGGTVEITERVADGSDCGLPGDPIGAGELCLMFEAAGFVDVSIDMEGPGEELRPGCVARLAILRARKEES